MATHAPGDRPVSELHWLSATEATRAFAARTLSPVELLQALLNRIEQLDPALNAFIRLDADAALDAARKREILPYLERLHDELAIPPRMTLRSRISSSAALPPRRR